MSRKVILGIDEVGRGPYAGPLVIGACILNNNTLPNQNDTLDEQSNNSVSLEDWYAELTDSKKLSAKKREHLNKLLLEHATCATGWVTAAELDQLGLTKSLMLATRRAVKQILKTKIKFDEIVIDGTINFLKGTALENYVVTMPKADYIIKEVSAASIVAKVARDHYMYELAQKYPEYGFDKNVGYGTAVHQKAMEKYGLTPEHRKSFAPVAKIYVESLSSTKKSTTNLTKQTPSSKVPITSIAKQVSSSKTTATSITCLSTKELGDRAENIVSDYLAKNGHKIIDRNHKTKFYEIDIISEKGNKLYFTEVKYRKKSTHGTPAQMVTAKKQDQMRFAAECYISYLQTSHHESAKKDPVLAVGLVSGPDFTFNDWFTLN